MAGDKDNPKQKLTKVIVLPSICLIVAFLLLGASFSILGPTLVHMRYLYNVSLSQISLVFTFFASGYTVGSILCGIVFDHFNREVQFFLTCMAIGITAIVCPWIPHVYGFFALVFLFSVSMGYLDSTGQPYTIILWSEHRLKGPIVQLLYSIWTLGNMLGPFVVRPFLVELPKEINTTSCHGYIESNMTIFKQSDNCTSPLNSTAIDGLHYVRYPFGIIGLSMCIASFSFLFVLCAIRKERSDINDKEKETSENKDIPIKDEKQKGDLVFKLVILILQFFFSFFLISTVGMISGLLPSFVVEGLKWPVDNGPLVTSIFMGGQFVARILAIPVSAVVQPTIILTFNVILSSVAVFIMLFVESAASWLLWVSTAMLGFGVGTSFPAAMLWTSTLMQMSGKVGSIFFIGGSVGIMGSTALVGYLMDNVSHMWLIYCCLICCLMDLLIFPTMYIFVRLYRRKKDRLEVIADVVSNGKNRDINNGNENKENGIYLEEMQPLNTV